MAFTTEKAFDMLPHVVDLYDNLDLDAYRKTIADKYKGKDVDKQAVGIDAFKFILKNAAKVKAEVFEIVAILEGKTAEEVKQQSFAQTVLSFKSILSDKEALDFFKQAMQ